MDSCIYELTDSVAHVSSGSVDNVDVTNDLFKVVNTD